jgi:hypothetical protein
MIEELSASNRCDCNDFRHFNSRSANSLDIEFGKRIRRTTAKQSGRYEAQIF